MKREHPRESASILVVDDEQVVCRSCERILGGDGHRVTSTLDPRQGLEIAAREHPDIAILDLKMPAMNGIELLRRIREVSPFTEVMIVTGYAEIQTAVEAMKLGARDYIPKPFSPDQLVIAVAKLLERRRLQTENEALRRELETRYRYQNIVGKSPKMRALFALVERVAPTSSTVLIRGESGTGKELVARAIHVASRRSAERFVAVDCGALSETVLESEMFGHVKGAFTGAVANRKGFFAMADGGTLFLDEIGNVSWNTQTKMLRVLQERTFQPVGATEPVPTDLRLIAATNRDLEAMVAEGTFREELYYRLNIIALAIPPLRERQEDIPALVAHFLEKHREETGSRALTLSGEAMARLVEYPWPGNVRELENAIQRAMVITPGERIEAEHLPADILPGSTSVCVAVPDTWPAFQKAKKELVDRTVAELERAFVRNALTRSDGNATRAAEDVGMLRPNFHALMSKHGLRSGQVAASAEPSARED